MNDFDATHLIWIVVVLVAVVGGLVARRPSLGTVARGLLAWGAIALVVTVIVVNKREISSVMASITSLGGSNQQVHGRTVRIRMAEDGHFWARVTVNGVERDMLIDSGASITSISEATAKAAGIEARRPFFPVILSTANGDVEARPAVAERVSIGPLETNDLKVVIAPNFGEMDLLGMNFLSRLKSWRVERDTLVMEPE